MDFTPDPTVQSSNEQDHKRAVRLVLLSALLAMAGTGVLALVGRAYTWYNRPVLQLTTSHLLIRDSLAVHGSRGYAFRRFIDDANQCTLGTMVEIYPPALYEPNRWPNSPVTKVIIRNAGGSPAHNVRIETTFDNNVQVFQEASPGSFADQFVKRDFANAAIYITSVPVLGPNKAFVITYRIDQYATDSAAGNPSPKTISYRAILSSDESASPPGRNRPQVEDIRKVILLEEGLGSKTPYVTLSLPKYKKNGPDGVYPVGLFLLEDFESPMRMYQGTCGYRGLQAYPDVTRLVPADTLVRHQGHDRLHKHRVGY